jgi:apolipoprotein N-acyltransferase
LFFSSLLSLLAGVAHALSLATWWDGQPLWWLQLASLAVLAWQVQRANSWLRAALTGWLFAQAWLTTTFCWLFVAMHTYGGLWAPLAVLAVAGLAGFLALYYAAACGLFVLVARGAGNVGRVLVFCACWTLAELARDVWFTGFPWGAAGYAHVQGPLAPYAPWAGVYGIGVVAAALAMLFALAVSCRRARWPALLAAAGLMLLPSGLKLAVPAFSKDAGSLQLALLQGNIPQDEKFQPGSGVPVALQWYGEQLQASRAPLVVAPETAIPLLPIDLPPGYLDDIVRRFSSEVSPQAAMLGIPLGSLASGYTNSVIGLKAGQARVWQYDKHHLVPFGEFIPPMFKWFTQLMDIPLGDFNRGGVGQPSFEWQGQRLAANVCYEDLFGEELGARFIDSARAPTLFVNLSNLAWFGDDLAISQHLQISRMRALEFERPFVRATNTGATAIIDHLGVVRQSLPRQTRGVLLGTVAGRTGETPFAWWVARLGLWPYWLASLATVLLVWRKRRAAA